MGDNTSNVFAKSVGFVLTCNQVSFFPFCVGDRWKRVPDTLPLHVVAHSPESGLLSDRSKNKTSFGALHKLVKEHFWPLVLSDTFYHLCLFMTVTTR